MAQFNGSVPEEFSSYMVQQHTIWQVPRSPICLWNVVWSEREKSQSLGKYWVTTAPGASWERLGNALYREGEETAAAMVKQYLSKGMCIS